MSRVRSRDNGDARLNIGCQLLQRRARKFTFWKGRQKRPQTLANECKAVGELPGSLLRSLRCDVGQSTQVRYFRFSERSAPQRSHRRVEARLSRKGCSLQPPGGDCWLAA